MMKALVAHRVIGTRIFNLVSGKSFGEGAEIKEVPIPTISDEDILVKVHVVALNPTDYKHIDIVSPRDSIIGCDYAGEVTSVGKHALGGWKVGDRVAGAVHGGIYPDRGAYAEYLKVDGDLAWKIPDEIDDEQAATFGIPAVTAMLALNVHLGLPWIDEAPQTAQAEGNYILIYAASTSVGLFAVQLAKKAGFTVIATSSPHSFDLVKSYGADKVFDYRSSSSIQEITAAFPKITKALDCFSEGKSAEFCGQVMQKNGGRLVTLLDQAKTKSPSVEVDTIMSYTLFGRPFSWLQPIGPKFPARPTDRKALARFYANLPVAVHDIQPPPLRVMNGGFEAVLKGIDELRQGKVSGAKLVVKL